MGDYICFQVFHKKLLIGRVFLDFFHKLMSQEVKLLGVEVGEESSDVVLFQKKQEGFYSRVNGFQVYFLGD